ncbi:MAG: DNA replication/repair protein RecF [Parachlamydiales bacterium]|nr:DNA replication/repair protein RecF [Parachlamydiales bacterium]
MQLQSLRLNNFRNYEEAFFVFSPKINVIKGNNAQGKTNLLEAIHLISTGRSFKTTCLKELIGNKNNFFLMEAVVISNNIEQTIRLYFDGEKKVLYHNDCVFPSFTPLLGIMPTVTQLPSDLSLITGTPSLRRKFLNIHIAQKDPLYLYHLGRYHRAIKQRNCLLKSKESKGFEVFEEEIARSGTYITQKRELLLQNLISPINEYLRLLTKNNETVQLGYLSPLLSFKERTDEYFEALKKGRKKDMLLGGTQIGPHRDDFSITINEQPAKTYASEGQKRTLIFSLRMAEYEQLLNATGHSPLFCMDDMDIHLDKDRKKDMQNLLCQTGQIFITTPKEEPVFPQEFSVASFTIEKGTIISSK